VTIKVRGQLIGVHFLSCKEKEEKEKEGSMRSLPKGMIEKFAIQV